MLRLDVKLGSSHISRPQPLTQEEEAYAPGTSCQLLHPKLGAPKYTVRTYITADSYCKIVLKWIYHLKMHSGQPVEHLHSNSNNYHSSLQYICPPHGDHHYATILHIYTSYCCPTHLHPFLFAPPPRSTSTHVMGYACSSSWRNSTAASSSSLNHPWSLSSESWPCGGGECMRKEDQEREHSDRMQVILK